MAALKVAFIGGTGIISSACAPAAVAAGHEVTLINRGRTSIRAVPDGVSVRLADARDEAALDAVIGDDTFDVVVNFVAFTADQVAADIERFGGRTGQYVFISSASAYQKPPRAPAGHASRRRCATRTGSTPATRSPARRLLMRAYRATGFPVTIVRPSHTYDASVRHRSTAAGR